MEPSYRSLKELLLGIASERSLDALLQRIVRGLAEQPDVALARVWLIQPGDICEVCPRREECPRHVPCLHLVASAGTSRDPAADWSRTTGEFRRFPIGVRKIGTVAQGQPVLVPEIARDPRWIAHPEWTEREAIVGFGGQPLIDPIDRGEVLGVLGVFTRAHFDSETHEWLQIVADHAASAIANARAFEEIERLHRELEIENKCLREEVGAQFGNFGDIIGSSPLLRRVVEQIELVAPTEATVLIEGESGTGKELVAREVHRRSARADRPLIQVNCASIPRELYESEFFGHVKGAFTGAVANRAGRFAAADRGTIFLDEVGEIPLELQSKLLRVLQEGSYERVGEERTRKADVRIIAATNRELRKEVEAGRFREDLYYRLNVFPIAVAPLRERREDIPALVGHFVERTARRLGRPVPNLTSAGCEALERYDWPGNVRELENAIERAMITSTGERLRFDLPELPGASGIPLPKPDTTRDAVLTEAQMRELERENIVAALKRSRWKVGGKDGAAELLGIKPTTLASRMRKLELERPD
nr:sigma 54-interacting transcriptional regulator [uncultured Brevundimonas sp.]